MCTMTLSSTLLVQSGEWRPSRPVRSNQKMHFCSYRIPNRLNNFSYGNSDRRGWTSLMICMYWILIPPTNYIFPQRSNSRWRINRRKTLSVDVPLETTPFITLILLCWNIPGDRGWVQIKTDCELPHRKVATTLL